MRPAWAVVWRWKSFGGGAGAYRELEAWRFTDYPSLHQRYSTFSLYPNREPYWLLVIEIPVARLWEFYLSRFFLPLLLIVLLNPGVLASVTRKPKELGPLTTMAPRLLTRIGKAAMAIIAYGSTANGLLYLTTP